MPAFGWGTVSGTPKSVTVNLQGFRFEMNHRQAGGVADYLDGTMWPKWQGCILCIPVMTCLLNVEWDPLVTPSTAKSVVKIGEAWGLGILTAGTTAKILNRDEALELAAVLRKLTGTAP